MCSTPRAKQAAHLKSNGNSVETGPRLPLSAIAKSHMLRITRSLATVLALAALTAAAPAQDTIKIGEYASLTGKEAAFGTSSHNGTVLALEEINAAGGVLGRQIELITEDDQSKQGEAATIVKKLISRDKVVGVLGEVASSRSLEAAPICQAYKVPMISPSSTNPKVTQIGTYIFRVCFIDPFQGTVMAKFAKSTLKLHRVALTNLRLVGVQRRPRKVLQGAFYLRTAAKSRSSRNSPRATRTSTPS